MIDGRSRPLGVIGSQGTGHFDDESPLVNGERPESVFELVSERDASKAAVSVAIGGLLGGMAALSTVALSFGLIYFLSSRQNARIARRTTTTVGAGRR